MKRYQLLLLITALVGITLTYYYTYYTCNSLVPSVPFYFIRHGQTDDNVANKAVGVTDTPLNDAGIQQAQAAADILKKRGIKTIVSSPLQRARQTAEIIAEKLNKPVVIIDELKERDFGSMEGEPITSLIMEWINNKLHLPDAEPYNVFQNRVIKGMEKALKLPGPVLIVAHGLVFFVIKNVLQLHHIPSINNCVPLYIDPRSQIAYGVCIRNHASLVTEAA